MTRRLLTLVLSVVIASIVLALTAGQAFANDVQCGDVITQDTTLDSDLVNCPGDGMVVGASNVTLNLNGHTVSGQGSGTGILVGDPNHNPDVSPCASGGAIVVNGTVEGFGHGVAYWYADGQADVSHMVLRRNGTGLIDERGCADLRAERNTVTDNSGDGVDTAFIGFDIRSNTITDNGGEGFYCAHGGGTLVGNVSARNGAAGMGFNGNCFGQSIVGNHITANKGPGVAGNDLVLQGNRISRNAEAGVIAAHSQIVGNAITRNLGDGISLGGPTGGLVADNVIAGNAANGIGLTASGTVRNNTVVDNGHDGIYADMNTWLTGGPQLEGNTSDRNGWNGIEVLEPEAVVGGNHTWFNGDLGISAVQGVTGSGNWAKHNGNALQCVPGFLCSTRGKPKG